MSRIKQYFITGLLVWLPMGITVWVLLWLVGILDGIFLGVLSALEAMIPGLSVLGERLRHIPGLGVILVAIVVFATGLFVANMFGQWWLRQWDRLMTRIGGAEHLFQRQAGVGHAVFRFRQAFSKAVLVQYPRQGAWTIAFLTGKPGGEVARYLAGDYISIYVPPPQPHLGLLPDGAAGRRGGTQDERGRSAQVRHFHGRGGATRALPPPPGEPAPVPQGARHHRPAQPAGGEASASGSSVSPGMSMSTTPPRPCAATTAVW